MKLADSHCHLDMPVFCPDRADVVKRFREAGGQAIMIAGVDEASARNAVMLADQFPEVYAAVGVHPHDAKDCTTETLRALRALCAHPKVKAWGEIGLDFNRMHSPRKIQEQVFLRQLDTAAEAGLPVIFHERDTQGRLLDLLSDTRPAREPRGVIHCFSGNRAELFRYLDLGLLIGVTGIVTIKSRGAALREIVPDIPLDRLLIETDAPYLTPAPEKNRIRRNEPAFVRSVLLKLSEILQVPPDTLSDTIWANTCRLFDLPNGVCP